MEAIRLFNKNVETQQEKREKRFLFVRGPLCLWIKMSVTWLSSCKSAVLAWNLDFINARKGLLNNMDLNSHQWVGKTLDQLDFQAAFVRCTENSF
jgi:hypothetical protein